MKREDGGYAGNSKLIDINIANGANECIDVLKRIGSGKLAATKTTSLLASLGRH